MSFAGHIFDMMRRDKENREALKQIRKRGSNASTHPAQMPRVSAEEFEQTRRTTNEHRRQERRTVSQLKLWVLGGLIVVVVLLSLLFNLFVLYP